MISFTDQQLLREYAERQREDAFAALVRRHIDFVYSAALRITRDPSAAEDVTQGVFVVLTTQARELSKRPVLAGWLHGTARNLAGKLIRSEVRRRAREQEAAAMNALLAPSPDPDWEQIAPHLDAALGELGEADRDALLLRFFERKSAREMARTLGISDEGAQKRVTRAVERLREYFAKSGVTVGASGLAVVISANAVQAAPIGLAVTISTAAALAGTTLARTATATATKAIAMTITQKVLIAAALAAAVGTGIYEVRRASTLRKQISALKQQQTDLNDQLASDRNDAGVQLAALRAENERLKGNTAELLKLRGEVTRLGREAARVKSLESELAKVRSEATEQIPPGASKLKISHSYLGREAWSDKGADTPHHALETMLWAGMAENTQRLTEVTVAGNNSLLVKDRPPLVKIKGVQIVSMDAGSADGPSRGVMQVAAIVEEEFYGGGLSAPPGIVQNVRSWYLIQTNGEWKVTGGKGSW